MNNYDKFKKAYVYKFTNRINGKWYIGARWNYNCNPLDDNYKSHSSSKEFWNDMKSGLLDREIIREFTEEDVPTTVVYNGIDIEITNVVILALYLEDKLIRDGWAKYGRKSSYNLRAQFLNNIKFNSDSESLSIAQRARWTEEARREKSDKMLGKNNHFYGKHHSEEFKALDSQRSKSLWQDDDYKDHQRKSHSGKVWVMNPDTQESRQIDPDKLSEYIAKGFKRGRAKYVHKTSRSSITRTNISKSKKCKKARLGLWLTPSGKEVVMSISNAKQFHKDWKLLIDNYTPDQSIDN